VSSMSIALYYRWSRVKVIGQSVSEETDIAQIDLEPDRRFTPICHRCGGKAAVHGCNSVKDGREVATKRLLNGVRNHLGQSGFVALCCIARPAT